MKKTKTVLTPEAAIRERRIRLADRRAARALLRKAVLIGAVFYLLFGVFFGITPMKGGDMQPKFAAGDILIYYRRYYDYLRNDVAVIERSDGKYVGRIIGTPGDKVDITDTGAVVINGATLIEPDIFYTTERYQGAVEFPLVLGRDEYFVLGDNRKNAKDSRYFGVVKANELRGRVVAAISRSDI